MTPNTAVLFLLAAAMLGSSLAAAVEKPYPLITIKCDPEADVLVITNSLLEGEEGARFNFSAADGTYSPWDMVEVARSSDSTRIIKSSKASTRCTLSSGEYTVSLEPQIFSHDLDKRCGEMISAAVTILHEGSEILERTAFEEYCHGTVPIITRITVLGKTAGYKIKRIPKSRFY